MYAKTFWSAITVNTEENNYPKISYEDQKD